MRRNTLGLPESFAHNYTRDTKSRNFVSNVSEIRNISCYGKFSVIKITHVLVILRRCFIIFLLLIEPVLWDIAGMVNIVCNFKIRILCSIQFYFSFANTFMCPLCTRHQYMTNTDPSVSSSLGKRVLICLKYRKIITIKLSCVGFIFAHGSLGAHEEEKKRKSYPEGRKDNTWAKSFRKWQVLPQRSLHRSKYHL